MRLTVLAVGFTRATSEGALIDDYIHRALQIGRNMDSPPSRAGSLHLQGARRQDANGGRPRNWPRACRPARNLFLLDAKGKA